MICINVHNSPKCSHIYSYFYDIDLPVCGMVAVQHSRGGQRCNPIHSTVQPHLFRRRRSAVASPSPSVFANHRPVPTGRPITARAAVRRQPIAAQPRSVQWPAPLVAAPAKWPDRVTVCAGTGSASGRYRCYRCPNLSLMPADFSRCLLIPGPRHAPQVMGARRDRRSVDWLMTNAARGGRFGAARDAVTADGRGGPEERRGRYSRGRR